MKIQSLKIRNFRSYSDNETSIIRFGKGINTIVGKNNVGKSAILKSLMFLKGELGESQENHYAGLENSTSYVELNVKLTESEIRSFISQLINPYVLDRKNREGIIKCQIKHFPAISYQKEGNTLAIKLGAFYIFGSLFQNSHPSKEPPTQRARKNLGNWNITHSHALLSTSLVDFLNNQFKEAKLPQIGILDTKIDLVQPFIKFLQSKLKIFPEFRQRPGGGDEAVLESFDGTRVASVLNTLKNGGTRQIRKWRRIKEKFSEFYPSLILDVRRPPQQSPIVWIEKRDIDYDVTIDKVGAGIAEFIIILTHLMDAKDTIFCMDNSEIHFHPHAQRKFMKLIETYSNNNQFILISHSTNFIQLSPLSNIIIIREDMGRSIINQLKSRWFTQSEIQKLERDMTPEMREIFFSDFVFLVEGSTETGAMPIFSDTMNKNFNEHNISILKVSGKYFDIPVKLCKGFELPYLVMCDKDALVNIETHYGKGDNRLECSPVIRLLLYLKLLSKSEKNIISNPNSIEEKGDKKKYKIELFIQLQEIAKKHKIFVLSSKFETILKRAGFQKYFDEIKKQGVRSKPIIGKYVATKILENNESVPTKFLEVLKQIP